MVYLCQSRNDIHRVSHYVSIRLVRLHKTTNSMTVLLYNGTIRTSSILDIPLSDYCTHRHLYTYLIIIIMFVIGGGE